MLLIRTLNQIVEISLEERGQVSKEDSSVSCDSDSDEGLREIQKIFDTK